MVAIVVAVMRWTVWQCQGEGRKGKKEEREYVSHLEWTVRGAWLGENRFLKLQL